VTEPSSSSPASLEHGPSCPCPRCTGFQPGNRYADGNQNNLQHGAYSRLSLQPRAKKLRDELASLIPLGTDSDAPALDLLALVLAQTERAGLALAVEQAESSARVQVGEPASPRLDRLAQDCRGWINTATRLLDALGMTPTSRARLAGDLAVASRDAGLARLAAEGRQIREAREAVNGD
jgi:hypothetical protein